MARQIDTALERVVRRVLRRRSATDARSTPERSAGCSPAIDAGVVYGSLLLITAAIAFLVSIFQSGDQAGGGDPWVPRLVDRRAYLVVFWSGAQRTPGMSFVAIRLLSEDAADVTVGQAIRRLLWMPIAALPLMLGFSGILLRNERQGGPTGGGHRRLLRGPRAGQGAPSSLRPKRPDLERVCNATPPRATDQQSTEGARMTRLIAIGAAAGALALAGCGRRRRFGRRNDRAGRRPDHYRDPDRPAGGGHRDDDQDIGFPVRAGPVATTRRSTTSTRRAHRRASAMASAPRPGRRS